MKTLTQKMSIIHWKIGLKRLKSKINFMECVMITCSKQYYNYTEYKVMDTKTHWVYSDKFHIRILDLSKVDVPGDTDPRVVKWARIFKAKTYAELEELVGEDEVLKTMSSYLKELSEDEKIRQQLQAREDYERRLIGQYNRGIREGREEGQQALATAIMKLKSGVSVDAIIADGISQETVDMANKLINSFATLDD